MRACPIAQSQGHTVCERWCEEGTNGHQYASTLEEQERIIKQMGGAEKLREEAAAFGRVVERYDARRKELLERYPNQWIAFTESGVVANDEERANVVRAARAQGLYNPYVIYRFVDPDPPIVIL